MTVELVACSLGAYNDLRYRRASRAVHHVPETSVRREREGCIHSLLILVLVGCVHLCGVPCLGWFRSAPIEPA